MKTLVLAVVAAAMSINPGGQGGRMYVQNNAQIKTIDPETGQVLALTPLHPLVSNRGLVYDEGRLYLINQNILFMRDFVVELSPATGRWSKVGTTGFSLQSGSVSLVRDPTTDRYFAQFNEAFFEVEPSTGQMTFLSRVEPAAAPALGLPDHHALVTTIFLGHPVHQPTRLKRKPVESFATRNRFDGPAFG